MLQITFTCSIDECFEKGNQPLIRPRNMVLNQPDFFPAGSGAAGYSKILLDVVNSLKQWVQKHGVEGILAIILGR